MGTCFISQFISKGWEWSLTGLFLSTLGCTTITFAAIYLKSFSLKTGDWKFLILGCLCIVIYVSSKDPWITTYFAILGDFILIIPTLVKGYKEPHTEKSFAWLLGLISWTFSIVTCINHAWLYALWPIYLILLNGTMVYFTMVNKTNFNTNNSN